MSDRFGPDMGNVYRTAEAVKGARAQREHNEFLRQQARRKQEQEQAVQGLRQRVAAGDEGAMKEMITMAPEDAIQVLRAYEALDERGKAQQRKNVEEVGRLAAYVLNSQNPEKAYQRVRANLNPELLAGVPERYDRDFVEYQLAQAMELEDLYAAPKTVDFGGETVMYRGGREIGRTRSSAQRSRDVSRQNALLRAQVTREGRKEKEAEKKKERKLSATDERFFMSGAESALGMDNSFMMGDEKQALSSQARKISSRAAQIYMTEEVSRVEALSRAVDEVAGAPAAPQVLPDQDQPSAMDIIRNKLWAR